MRNRSLLFAALLSGLMLNPVPASATVVPGNGICELTAGLGTSASPFQITDAATLAEVIECDEPAEKNVGETPHVFKLMNNIDASTLTGPIKDDNINSYFVGLLDGDNKTISNISLSGTSDIALFHSIDGSVRDLTLAGSISSTAGSQGASYGALASWTYSNAQIQNVTSSAAVNALDSSGSGGAIEVGGLVGTMTGGTLTDVTVSGVVKGKSSVGGVVGRAYGSVTITNARKLTGAITASINPSGWASAGGVVGDAGANVQLVDVESQVYILARDSSRGDYVGGLVGRLEGSIVGGDVNSTLDIYGGNGTGGAVGLLAGGSVSEVSIASSVTVNSNTTGVGGLVGIAAQGFTVSKSFSLADVKAFNNSFNGPQERVGGLIGQASQAFAGGLIENSFAAGEIVNGSNATGGLVGYLDGDLTINNSYAALPINSSASQTGGLVGEVTQASLLTTSGAYWDVDLTTETTTALNEGTGLSTARFLDPENLNGFNFSTNWGYKAALDPAYPRLRWTNASAGYWASELGFTVAYDRNGGTGGTLPESVTQATSSTLTVPTSDVGILKNGFTFGGWALSNGATTASSTVTFDADKSLFAVWLSETVAPSVTAAVLASNGTALTITFSEPVGAKTAPLGFSVVVGGASAAFTAGNVVDSGTSLVLTLGQAASFGDSVELSYDDSVGSLEDKAGSPNALATFAALSVTNNVPTPSNNPTPVVSAPYIGPVLTAFSTRVLDQCNPTTVTITGSNLQGVQVSLQGKSAIVVSSSATTLVLTFPAGLESATSASLELISSAGSLRVQDAFSIPVSDCEATGAQVDSKSRWTKLLADGENVKVYAKNPVGDGKIQFLVNGREIAWVRAESESDPKLRKANGVSYLVRSVQLAPVKNRIEIRVEGERVWFATYVPKLS